MKNYRVRKFVNHPATYVAVLLICIFFIMLQSCAVKGPKAVAVHMMDVYDSQFSDYMRMTGYVEGEDGEWIKTFEPVLSEEQKAVLRKKKKRLSEVYPLINTYSNIVEGGLTPSADSEQAIFDILNSL